MLRRGRLCNSLLACIHPLQFFDLVTVKVLTRCILTHLLQIQVTLLLSYIFVPSSALLCVHCHLMP